MPVFPPCCLIALALKMAQAHRNKEDDGMKQEESWELFNLSPSPKMPLSSSRNPTVQSTENFQNA